MLFISAGHCTVPGPNQDPGAIGVNGRWEAKETLKIRNRVVDILKNDYQYNKIATDLDGESLGQYVNRINTGSGSVVCEFHFNAAANPAATGTEVLVEVDADRLDRAAALRLAQATGSILRIPLRAGGVKSEAETRHGRLALMKETGIVVLVEVCFISNPVDMQRFDQHFEELCQAYARLLFEFEAWAV